MRQVILDTETTGIEVAAGHRIIEVGAVEISDRRSTGAHFHEYLNPNRAIDAGAQEVHGISSEFLADKPPFERVAERLFDFVFGAELIMHNAGFDIAFLNAEFARLKATDFPRLAKALGVRNGRCRGALERVCSVVDSLALARKKHPGQRNGLDTLCRRYQVDNSGRTFHGALLDAELLAEVYLRMTGGQTALFSAADDGNQTESNAEPWTPPDQLRLIEPTPAEHSEHEAFLKIIEAKAGVVLWSQPPITETG
ncbi:MAG: DNA polymerase III subunit epsilon [Pseudomonadota bacterium]